MVKLPGSVLQTLFIGRPSRALTRVKEDNECPIGRSTLDWGFSLLLCLQRLGPEFFCFNINFLNELQYTDVQSRNLVNVNQM